MFKNNVKCYGEALDLLINMNTPINKGIVDYLSDYRGVKHEVSKVYKERKYKSILKEGNVEETIVFLSFICDSLNAIMNKKDETSLGSTLITHSYFEKENKSNKYEITFYKVDQKVDLKIEFAPKSKIGKLLSFKSYLTPNRINKIIKNQKYNSEKIFFNISLEDMNRALKNNDTDVNVNAIEEIAMKKFVLSKGRINTHSDNTTELREYNEMGGENYPLITGVTNHYLYMNLLMDVSRRFKENEGSVQNKIEVELLESLFFKNVLLLDALSDLAHMNKDIHKGIWESALLSLSDGEIPFVMNFKKSRGSTFDFFAENLYVKLNEIEKDNQEKEKDSQFQILGLMDKNSLRMYSALMKNLVMNRVLSNEINNSPALKNLVSILKEKAKFFKTFEGRNVTEDLIETIDIDLDSFWSMKLEEQYEDYGDVLNEAIGNAINFINVYSYDVNNLRLYSDSPYDDKEESSSFEYALKDGIFILNESSIVSRTERGYDVYHTVVNVEEMFDQLGFEHNNVNKFIYMSILKKELELFFPNLMVSISGINNEIMNMQEIEKHLNHGEIKRFKEIDERLNNLPEKMLIEITSLNVSDENKNSYELMALGAVGKILNASIFQKFKYYLDINKMGGDENFTSSTRNLMSYHNGQIVIESVNTMMAIYAFFNRDYIKEESMKENIKNSIREFELNYRMSKITKDNVDRNIRRKI